MATFSLILSRPDFQSGILTGQQEIDLQRYFLDVHERQANGDQFPFNLEELVPTVYTSKQMAVKALTKGYTQDVDFSIDNPTIVCNGFGAGQNPVVYRLSSATFEHLVAKKNRAIFEVYRRVFHAAAAEAIKQITKPDSGTVAALNAAAKALRLSPSAHLGMLNRYFSKFPLVADALPAYATDAPEGETSSLPTAAAKDLLLKHQVGMGPVAFNNILEQEGYIERLTRPSCKEVDSNNQPVIRHFVSVTEKGLAYGKNGTHPNNPKETQPHWYRDKFPQLLEAVGLRASL